jgi:drug/metabolite transporter (DMT)-like permease
VEGADAPVALGLAAALAACLCYGIASVFQAIGARGVAQGNGVDPKLIMRVLRSMPFLGGTALDTLALVFNFYALRTLPLFTVQAVINTNLAVTALVSVLLLGATLSTRDKVAVAVVIGGLTMLGISSGREGSGSFDVSQRWIMLVVALVLSATALVIGNLYKKPHPALLGGLAGFLFGLFGIAVRVLPSLSPSHLIVDPGAYAALVSSGTAFLLFTTALQRGSVTAATAALVVGETAVPALIGLVFLGDTARHGYAPVGVFGFLFAVGGALALARFGEPVDEHTVEELVERVTV